MKIENLKDLEALVKMCRKHEVRSITVDGITMAIDTLQPELKTEPTAQASSAFPHLTDEQVMFYSSTPVGE